MKVGVQVGEGQPLSWDRWRHIVELTERLGFHSLFRSDHYWNGVQKDSIDVFLSHVATGIESTNIRFGTLVTPVTFREPVNVGRAAQQLDALSGGRFVLGLGVGWYELEHKVFGLAYPSLTERYERLEEAIELMKVLWYSTDGHFDGKYYQLAGTNSQPHPPAGRPPILIGGTGQKKTLAMTAKYADEWNATANNVERYKEAAAALEQHCEAIGRDPQSIRRSALIFTSLSPDEATELHTLQRLIDMTQPGRTIEEVVASGRGPWRGSVEQMIDHIGQLGELGCDEVFFDHVSHDSDVIPEFWAAEVAPKVVNL